MSSPFGKPKYRQFIEELDSKRPKKKDKPVVDGLNIEIPKTILQTDPLVKILKVKNKVIASEVSGYLFAIELEAKDFTSFEIYNFIEIKLEKEVADIVIMHNEAGNATGIILVQLIEPITESHLNILNECQFDGSSIHTILFKSLNEYDQYLDLLIKSKLSKISLPIKRATPQIYIYNFVGDENELEELLQKCGQINLIQKKIIKDFCYYIVCFANEGSARLCYRTFNRFPYNGTNIIASPYFPRATERVVGIRGCFDLIWLKQQVSFFGIIEQDKITNDGTAYFLMNSPESSKLVCMLLFGREYQNNFLDTFFVDYHTFTQLKA